MGKQEVIDYVMNSPANSNEAVLRGMLDSIASGSGGEKGYECTEEWVTLTEESVTTAGVEGDESLADGQLSHSNFIDANQIRVTFNGTEYLCAKNNADAGLSDYGAAWNEDTQSMDWSEYPFEIFSGHEPDKSVFNRLSTEEAGTYQVKIEVFKETVTTSECFEKAVNKVVVPTTPLVLKLYPNSQDKDEVQNATFGEIAEAYLAGRSVLLDPNEEEGGDTPIGPTPALLSKAYYSLIGLKQIQSLGAGGSLIFGGETVTVFEAASDDEHPVAK